MAVLRDIIDHRNRKMEVRPLRKKCVYCSTVIENLAQVVEMVVLVSGCSVVTKGCGEPHRWSKMKQPLPYPFSDGRRVRAALEEGLH